MLNLWLISIIPMLWYNLQNTLLHSRTFKIIVPFYYFGKCCSLFIYIFGPNGEGKDHFFNFGDSCIHVRRSSWQQFFCFISFALQSGLKFFIFKNYSNFWLSKKKNSFLSHFTNDITNICHEWHIYHHCQHHCQHHTFSSLFINYQFNSFLISCQFIFS